MNAPRPGPLTGRTVVVTRAEGPEGPLGRRLSGMGARVLNWPAIFFRGPADPAPLNEALGRLADYDWIVFTSPRAVAAVLERISAPPPRGRPRVAAVGAATAAALAGAGWPIDLVPERFQGTQLVAALGEAGLSAGDRVLFPASSLARPTVPEGLRGLGAVVDKIEAYRTVPAGPATGEIRKILEAGQVDLITFASPSAVSGLEAVLGTDHLRRLLERVPAAVIGPVTAAAARQAGARRVVESGANDLDGLAAATVQACEPSTVEH